MKDNDGWETISTVGQPASNDGWEPIPVTETPEYRSSYSQLREDALRVGYSGLTPEQKEMIKSAYPQSLAGKAGLSFEEMAAKMDQQAGKFVNEEPSLAQTAVKGARDLYQGAREIIGKGTNLIPAAAAGFAGEEHKLGPDGIAILDPEKQSFMDRASKEYDASNQEVANNQGFQSIVADPMNYIGFGLGAASRIPQLERLGMMANTSEWLKSNPKTLVGARVLGGAAEGMGGSYLGRRDLELTPSVADVASGVIGGTINPIVRGSAANPRSLSELKDIEQEALRQFPGDKFVQTQARKAGQHVDERTMHLTDAEKLAILEGVSNQAGPRNPNVDEWIDFQRAKQAEAHNKYVIADEEAKLNQQYGDRGFVPFEDLRKNMITRLEKGIGDYTKDDAQRFVDSRLAGWKEKYGDKIPLHELTRIKSTFNNDIFDPRATVSEGITQKRQMARAAGREITDKLNEPAFRSMQDLPALPASSSELYDIGQALPLRSYNELVGQAGRDAYRQSEVLSDIFAHQGVPTGSQRVGASGQGLIKDLYSSLFPGGRKFYSSTGDAYAEPVMKWRASKPESALKRGIGGGLVGGIVPLTSQLPEVPEAVKHHKKKK